MPEKVTKNFIHMPAPGASDRGFVAGFGRYITVDKSRGIKANIGKLKGTGKTRIRTYLFPTGKFTRATARLEIFLRDVEIPIGTLPSSTKF